MSDTPHTPIAIIGSGFAGLGLAIRLKQAGFDDFAILERAHDVGGTWRDNTYPGCGCDVESHLYSFSFAPNPEWSRMYSRQPEILAYLRGCAERFGLMPHMRFGQEVREASWDDERRVWRIETATGRLTADFLAAGFGPLSEPSVPQLPGLENFEGPVFHSAQWDHGYELSGKRVVVVGTGASAVQFVPAIQPKVARMTVFQRTPAWILPHHDRPISELEKLMFRLFPQTQAIARGLIYLYRELYVFGFRDPQVMRFAQQIALRHLERAVKDPALRAKLTPDYTLGCKRVMLSDDYWPALAKPNVELVTESIAEIRANAVVDSAGREHPADAIILATGFKTTEPTIAKHLHGRGGVSLAEAWQGSPKAYLGTTVAGFPNLFMLLGPNTGLGHTSVVLMLESQFEHVLGALRHMREHAAATLEPRPEVQATYLAELEGLLEGTVWTAGRCMSWYMDPTGRNSTLWPSFTSGYAQRVERFIPEDYRLEPAARPSAPAPQPTGGPV